MEVMTLTRAATLIQYGLVSKNDQLIQEGIQILRTIGCEPKGHFGPLLAAQTDKEYEIAKRHLHTKLVCMSGGGKRR